jgi:hypothetical protein
VSEQRYLVASLGWHNRRNQKQRPDSGARMRRFLVASIRQNEANGN